MLMVTGDTHRDIDIQKIFYKDFTPEDIIIICGDCGFIWGSRHEDDVWMTKVRKHCKAQIMFVDGNHENFSRLNNYPVSEVYGGKVHEIADGIYHMIRGEIYVIEGNTIFAMGGASSHDHQFRIEGKSWWAEELHSTDDIDNALTNLLRVGGKVDYVVTHCAPSTTQMSLNSSYAPDICTNFLDVIKESISFKKWYFGHYHVDEDISQKFSCLYKTVKEIGK